MNDWYSIEREGIYTTLGLRPNHPIPRDFTFQGKLLLTFGYRAAKWESWAEVRVEPSNHQKHRIKVRCLSCHKWIPFGRMHQHFGTKACCA